MSSQTDRLAGSSMAIYWDWQNVKANQKEIEALIQFFLARKVTIKSKIVYADWSFDCKKRQAEYLYRMGFDCINVPSSKEKNRADKKLVEHCEQIILDPFIDSVMIISGDGDFKQLVHKLKQNGKTVIIVSRSLSSTDARLRKIADEFYLFSEIEAYLQALSMAA